MSDSGNRYLGWRGPVSENERTDAFSSQHGSRGRVLVAVATEGNRRQLLQQLAEDFQIIDPRVDTVPNGSFDIAITDLAGVREWHELILDAKSQEEPTFLPVVLLLSQSELRMRFGSNWDLVDEFVIAPINPYELRARLDMLLRTRRLAVAQRDRLAYLVNHDRITGLPNQTLFMSRLVDVVRDASVLGQVVHVGVIRMPLISVLTSLGHHAMEKVAFKATSRLISLLREEVSLARIATHDWAFFHRPDASLEQVLDVCRRIRSIADAPVEVGHETIHLAPSVGLAVYPNDGDDATNTLDAAIAALSQVHGNSPSFYSSELRQRALRTMRTESGLREALARHQLELLYQPQVDIESGRAAGIEALVRWRLPSGELVPPSQFIPVAEATGLITEIDRWVLRHACKVGRLWQEAGYQVPRISVNVVAQDVHKADFVDVVLGALQDCQVSPGNLEIELTESALLDVRDENLEKLRKLRELGVRIAVDDFGTGYSSLGYLHALPITTLKIDRQFVRHIVEDPTSLAITETIQLLAGRFGLETVAEGIEHPEQAEVLRRLGVTLAQGYLYARPMPENELLTWLSNNLMLN